MTRDSRILDGTMRFKAILAALFASVPTIVNGAPHLSQTDLLVLASGVLVTEGNPENLTPALVAAFALVESSGNPQAVGDRGKARGLYQHHRDRWIEDGGAAGEWGKATPLEQTRVMVRSLTRYSRLARKAGVPRLEAMAKMHCIGSLEAEMTPKRVQAVKSYLIRLSAALQELLS